LFQWVTLFGGFFSGAKALQDHTTTFCSVMTGSWYFTTRVSRGSSGTRVELYNSRAGLMDYQKKRDGY